MDVFAAAALAPSTMVVALVIEPTVFAEPVRAPCASVSVMTAVAKSRQPPVVVKLAVAEPNEVLTPVVTPSPKDMVIVDLDGRHIHGAK